MNIKINHHELAQSLLLYLQLWIIATLLAWVLVSIFGYGNDNYTGVDFSWHDYTWGDFCFDAVSMGVLIGASMAFNALFIYLFKPLQDYHGRALVYSVLLLAMNVAMSMLIMRATEWICGAEMPHNEFVNCTYMYCLVAALISSIHANYSFQRMYISQQQEKHALELKAAHQEEVTLQTSLLALKTQVDPHFLFNNFSILSDLIDESPSEAKAFLSDLSRVYRFKLVNMNTDLVCAEAELSMVRSYVSLLEGHYGQALLVVFPCTDDMDKVRDWSLPPLAVQLAVENAVKHNARSSAVPLVVRISVAEGEVPMIIVTNPIRPLSSKVESTGMGLRNLSERYALTCGCQPTIVDDGAHFCVKLPLAKQW